MYVAITEFYEKESCMKFVILDEEFNIKSQPNIMNRNEFGTYVMSSNLVPINFEVTRAGEIKESCGAFSRLKRTSPTQQIGVVLAEIKTSGGRSLGYRILNTANYVVSNIMTNEIVSMSKTQKEPFLHNGIIRNDTVNCYPLHKFAVITIEMQRKRKKQPKVEAEKPKKAEKVSKTKQSKPVEPKVYTDKQLNEINRCKTALGNSALIENPNLSDKQMRVLWIAKKNGVLAEHFAKPEYSVDVMKFYADRLFSEKVVSDCEGMLSKPDLSVPALAELYLCVCDGIPYDDLLDSSVDSIRCKREERKSGFWVTAGDSSDSDGIINKTIDYAMKLRGY